MFFGMLWFALAWAGNAKQDDFDRHGNEFEVRYRDIGGSHRTVKFELSSREVEEGLDARLAFPQKQAVKAQVEAVRRYADGLHGVTLKAKGTRNGVKMSASGTSRKKIKEALKGGQKAANRGLDKFLEDEHWIRRGKDLFPDHIRWVKEESKHVKPAATAIMKGDNAREDIDLALRYLQAVPYEARKGGGDKGFRPPVSVLAKNKGDCDSKSTLLLAMVRAKYPEVKGAIVYTKGHAFAAFELPPKEGDKVIKEKGRVWVAAEPVGPQELKLGKVGKYSAKKIRGGKVDVVEVK